MREYPKSLGISGFGLTSKVEDSAQVRCEYANLSNSSAPSGQREFAHRKVKHGNRFSSQIEIIVAAEQGCSSHLLPVDKTLLDHNRWGMSSSHGVWFGLNTICSRALLAATQRCRDYCLALTFSKRVTWPSFSSVDFWIVGVLHVATDCTSELQPATEFFFFENQFSERNRHASNWWI